MKPCRHAFTLIELLVVISVIALLIAILLPVLGTARETARNAQCQSNLRQWGIALHAYLNDFNYTLPHEGKLVGVALATTPDPGAWFNDLPPYINAKRYYEVFGTAEQYANDSIWWCPTVDAEFGSGTATASGNNFAYGFNAVLNGTGSYGPNLNATMKNVWLDSVKTLSNAVILSEPSSRVPTVSIGSLSRFRHFEDENVNILFGDSHVGSEKQEGANTVSSGSTTTIWKSAEDRLHWGVYR